MSGASERASEREREGRTKSELKLTEKSESVVGTVNSIYICIFKMKRVRMRE